MFSVIGGLLALVGLLRILQELGLRRGVISLCGLLFIFSNVFYIIFRSTRPDGWIVTFAVWGAYFLITAINTRKDLRFFLAGLLGSSSFLCHPHGALYILLFGAVTLVFSWKEKTPRFLLYYLAGCFVVLASFLFHRVVVKKLEFFSFADKWLSRTSMGPEETKRLTSSADHYFSTFVKQYILGAKRAFVLIFELGVLVVGLFHFKRKNLFITSLLGISYFLIAMFFLRPFATRHFGEVVIFSLVAYGLLLQAYKAKKRISLLLLVTGLAYLLNNVAGDVYVLGKGFHQISYGALERKIDKIVPDHTKVLTLMHFWFPLKNNVNYNSYTRWQKTEYESLDDLLASGDVQYVVISDYLTKGITPTSSRKASDRLIEKEKIYYEKAHDYAVENADLVETIATEKYGTIEIWEIKKRKYIYKTF
jgi:hypothetical protein